MPKRSILTLLSLAALLPAATFAQGEVQAPGRPQGPQFPGLDAFRQPARKECQVCHKKTWPVFEYDMDDGTKLVMCGECAEADSCNYCPRPAAEDSGGGEMLCAECLKTAVKTQEQAESELKDVRKALETKFKLTTKHKIDYEIGTRKDLNRKADEDQPELGWFDPNTIRGKQHFTIRILKGLPLDVFRMTAAHELAHDWMHETLPHLMDKQEVCEGFAEFVAWSFSRSEKAARAMKYTERRTDPVYGEGFRKVRKMMEEEKAESAPEWKAVLLKHYPIEQKKRGRQ